MDAKRILGKSQVGTGRVREDDQVCLCRREHQRREPVMEREVMMCLSPIAAANVMLVVYM